MRINYHFPEIRLTKNSVMKMRYSSVLFFALAILLSSGLNGANLYVLFDEACMDRLEYKYTNAKKGKDYIVYHINVNAKQKIVLEVGPESQTYQTTPPQPLLSCGNTTFDLNLVETINRKIDQVYMVVKKGNRKFYLSPVSFASHYDFDGELMKYISPKYQFIFNVNHGAIGENISYINPNAKVYFEGKLENECSGSLLFRQIAQGSQVPFTDLVFVPEIGVVEERSGINSDDAILNTIKLVKVNSSSLNKHLRLLCDPTAQRGNSVQPLDEFAARGVSPQQFSGEPMEPGGGGGNVQAPTEPGEPGGPIEPNYENSNSDNNTNSYSNNSGANAPIEPVYTPPTSSSSNNYTAPVTPAPAPTPSSPSYYTVKKGDTLYGISRKHGISVAQLRQWNSLGSSNLIRQGDQLKVNGSAPSSYSNAGSTENFTERSVANVTNNNAGPIHIVRSGETMASIAMKYGYTEERFRKINGMSANQMALVNQRLKTTDCNCPEGIAGSSANSSSEFTTRGVPSSYGNSQVSSSLYNRTGKKKYSPSVKTTPTFYGQSNRNQENETFQNGSLDAITPIDAGYPQDEFTTRGVSGATSQFANKGASNSSSNAKRIVHVVQEGESLYRIARMYGTTVQRIRDLNNLEVNEVLIPYQRIYIN